MKQAHLDQGEFRQPDQTGTRLRERVGRNRRRKDKVRTEIKKCFAGSRLNHGASRSTVHRGEKAIRIRRYGIKMKRCSWFWLRNSRGVVRRGIHVDSASANTMLIPEGSSQINSTKGRGIDVRLYHQHRAFAPHLGKQITIEASLALKMKWRNSNAGNTGVTPKSRRQR